MSSVYVLFWQLSEVGDESAQKVHNAAYRLDSNACLLHVQPDLWRFKQPQHAFPRFHFVNH